MQFEKKNLFFGITSLFPCFWCARSSANYIYFSLNFHSLYFSLNSFLVMQFDFFFFFLQLTWLFGWLCRLLVVQSSAWSSTRKATSTPSAALSTVSWATTRTANTLFQATNCPTSSKPPPAASLCSWSAAKGATQRPSLMCRLWTWPVATTIPSVDAIHRIVIV